MSRGPRALHGKRNEDRLRVWVTCWLFGRRGEITKIFTCESQAVAEGRGKIPRGEADGISHRDPRSPVDCCHFAAPPKQPTRRIFLSGKMQILNLSLCAKGVLVLFASDCAIGGQGPNGSPSMDSPAAGVTTSETRLL